jgi:hypothetical protein
MRQRGEAPVTLSEMFVGQDAQTFEERRDEVVSIVRSAMDLAGVDRGLAALMQRLTVATDENQFDDVFAEIVGCIRDTTPALFDLA